MSGRWGALVAVVRGAFRPGLSVAGLACLVASAWTLSFPFGLAAAGVAFLVLEFLLDDPQEGETG